MGRFERYGQRVSAGDISGGKPEPAQWESKGGDSGRDQGPHRDEGRDKQQEAIDRKNKARIAQMEADKKAAEKAKKAKISEKIKTGIETVKDVGKKVKPTLQKFLYGQEAAPGVTKEQFEKEGQHKLRSQFDYLSKKYGEGFADTSQGKLLRDYLSGVPVERGGGLGAQDFTYGAGGDPIGFNKQAEGQDDPEVYRRGLLNQIASGRYGFGDININDALARKGLSPDQYFNFRQQLMAADPSVGNVAYKEAFPFASGQLAQGIASVMPGTGMIGKAAKALTGKLGAGGIGDWFKFNPPAEAYTNIGTPFAAAPSVRPDIDRGGVIDAAQSRVDQQSPYGGWIGSDPNQPRTADFIDGDRDGVDDRWQTGPGTPNMNPALGGDSKLPGFEVGQIMPHPITLPQAPFSGQTDLAASQAAGYDIPIGGAQTPNLQDWYKNLGIMQNVYR